MQEVLILKKIFLGSAFAFALITGVLASENAEAKAIVEPENAPVYISSYNADKAGIGSKFVTATGSWIGGNGFYGVVIDWDDVDQFTGAPLYSRWSGSAKNQSFPHLYGATKLDAYTTIKVTSGTYSDNDTSYVDLRY